MILLHRPPISELIDVFVASCPVARFPWRWSKVCVVNILVLVSMMDGCRHIGRENLIDFPFLFPLDSKDAAGNQNDSIWAKIEVSLDILQSSYFFSFTAKYLSGWMPFTQLMSSFVLPFAPLSTGFASLPHICGTAQLVLVPKVLAD